MSKKPEKPKMRKAEHEAAPPSPGDYEEIEKRLKAGGLGLRRRAAI